MRRPTHSLVLPCLCGLLFSSCALPPLDPGEEIAETSARLLCDESQLPAFDPVLVVSRETHAELLDYLFPLEAVLQAWIATGGGDAAQSPEELYQRLWDVLGMRANGVFQEPFAPHCDDDEGRVNGFPIQCPRPESVLASSTPGFFRPVALFNRFDLAPVDGVHCGEYRIVYALQEFSFADRVFMILEAALPNPRPAEGLAACLPVARFWAELEGLSEVELAAALMQLFYVGLADFPPVFRAAHYAGEGHGQVRVNLFGNQSLRWQLRQFRVARSAPDASGVLFFEPSGLSSNPDGYLFTSQPPATASATARGLQPDFQALFTSSDLGSGRPSLTSLLATDTLSALALPTLGEAERFNAAQSNTQAVLAPDDYRRTLDDGFRRAIQGELTRLGRSDLTPDDIIVRALTQTCAGCHRFVPHGARLGAGLRWLGGSWDFTHVRENGQLSPGLRTQFLPQRQAVLRDFLCGTPSVAR